MHILNLTLCGTEFFVDFGKSTGLMDLFQEKLCYKKITAEEVEGLEGFFVKSYHGEKDCDGISGAFFPGIVKQQVF